MASLYITEYAGLAVMDGTQVQCGQEPALQTQKLAIGAEVDSTAFHAQTRFVRLHTDAICSVKFSSGAAVNATTNDTRLAANQTEFFGVQPGGNLSVISNT